MRPFPSAALAASLALLAALAAPARAGVDVEVPATFKAKGTLAPGVADDYRFLAGQGTLVNATVAGAKGAAAPPEVAVMFAEGGAVPAPGGTVVASGTKVLVKNLEIPSTGEYVLRVTGSGGYSLAFKAKPRAAWTGTVMVAPMGAADFFLALPKGATVSLVAKPAPGSAAAGRLVSLDPDDSSIDLSGLGRKTATSHAVTYGPVAGGGDYNLVVGNEGAAGLVAVTAKVRPPKSKPGKFDLRGAALGRPGGAGFLVGRSMDFQGGTVQVEDASTVLLGAGVSIPPMAIPGPTLVTVASAEDPPLGDPDDQAAGPAVRFEPSGLHFVVPVEVTLPVDFTKLPAGTTPADVRVRIVEDDGSAIEVPPASVGSRTVTVPTSGFSVCIPVVVSGPPNFGYSAFGDLKPGGDEYWLLQADAEIVPGGGTDSRSRSMTTGVGQVSVHAGGTIDFSVSGHGFQWANSDSPPMSGQPLLGGVVETTYSDGGTLDWAYDPTGTMMVLSGAPENLPSFRVSRDGRYLAGFHDAQAEPFGEFLLAVRKNAAALTTASLKGAYTACFLEAEYLSGTASGAAGPRPSRAYGTFQFDGAGKVAITLAQRDAEFRDSTGTWAQVGGSFSIKDATYAVDGNGTLLVTVPPLSEDDGGTVLRLFPGEGLNVLFGTHDPPVGEPAMALVLVRQGNGMSRSDLAGRWHGGSFGVDLGTYGIPATPAPIPDFSINVETFVASFDGGAAADFEGSVFHAERDSMAAGGTRVENSGESFTVSVSLTSQGKAVLAQEGKVLGQATPDAQALFLVSDTGSADSDFGLLVLLRSPPPKVP